jgi:ABC-type transporter Mla maintaining outer membrane lipid asymmetry ATPase subunit MlaF
MEPAQHSQEMPVIEMHEVSAAALRDPATIAAENVNWTVMPGDYWVVAGLQGSGKSDFLMMTASLTAPAAGSYTLFGEKMPIFDEHRLKQRLRLGLVFESGQLFNHLTVMQNVVLPLRYHYDLSSAEAKERAAQLLEIMELEPWADSTPGAIGRNWQKRVGLARALALKPEVLLLDNPLVGLDVRHMRWWLSFLKHLSKGHSLMDGHKVTLIVTTPDLRPWKAQARQFAILREKSFSVLGTWSQLESASSELVQELLLTESHT